MALRDWQGRKTVEYEFWEVAFRTLGSATGRGNSMVVKFQELTANPKEPRLDNFGPIFGTGYKSYTSAIKDVGVELRNNKGAILKDKYNDVLQRARNVLSDRKNASANAKNKDQGHAAAIINWQALVSKLAS